MEFIESFMRFSFDDDDLFRIEDDELIKSLSGINTCECVVMINEHVALIEAKSSSPQPTNKDDFDRWIEGIRDKFADSLQLFYEFKIKKRGEEAFNRLPVNLQSCVWDPEKCIIYLIVHGNEEYWMEGIQNALREAMRDVVNKWNLNDSHIKAINDTLALEMHLIVESLGRSNA